MSALFIVESPTKADTIQRIYPGVKAIATKGHLQDLPEKEFGITIENGTFIPTWQLIQGKEKTIGSIKKYAATADNIYLAVDDDREGESIARQVQERALKNRPFVRIVFHEITKEAIDKAIIVGRSIDDNIVKAAHTRRMADREIGYLMGEIMRYDFKKNEVEFRPKAVGRVLMPALKILADNYRAIDAFVPEKSIQFAIEYLHKGVSFTAYIKEHFDPNNLATRDAAMHTIQNAAHRVAQFKRKNKEIPPHPPLVTSRLIRSAFYLFHTTPEETMQQAQALFEKGLITYMRTDSTAQSEEAITAIRNLLHRFFDQEYCAIKPRYYKNNTKSAQGAHEAIRPVYFDDTAFPKNIDFEAIGLTPGHKQLYEFIWYRTIATQMSNAIYDASKCQIEIGDDYIAHAEANTRLFDGWERVNNHLLKEAEIDEERDEAPPTKLPEMFIDESLLHQNIAPLDRTTKAPGRYGVGRFITTIEEFTRPSTIVDIVKRMIQHKYVENINGYLIITPLGMSVLQWAEEHAPWVVDKENCARLEIALDQIESGEMVNPDEVLRTYLELIEQMKKKLQYIEWDKQPLSDAQKGLVQLIVKKQRLSDEVRDLAMSSKRECEQFLKQYHQQPERIGRCPACKKGDIIEYEKFFGCKEYKNGCTFSINKLSVIKQFRAMKRELSYQEVSSIVGEAIRKKRVHVAGLQGRKGQFDADFSIGYDKQYGWQLKFSSSKKR